MIGSEFLKAMFENIKSEYTPYHLPDEDVIRCHEISKVANKNFQDCKSLIRKWQREVEENNDDFILEVFESMSSDVLDPSTYRKRKFDPVLQGRKANFSVYTQLKNNKYYLLASEIKSPRHMSSKKIDFLNCDLVKLGNEMKDMLDKCIEDGFQCSVFIMDLKFDAIYRMIPLRKFFLPQNIHNLNIIAIAIEELMQARNIICRSAKLCFQDLFQRSKVPSIASTTPVTPIRNGMMRQSFHTPIKVPTNRIFNSSYNSSYVTSIN
ncbi:19886_t:CDS:2, partial [Gigaspora rosea]